ncbi:hypothetical protein ACHAPU_002674 [Fusarium lateritium]
MRYPYNPNQILCKIGLLDSFEAAETAQPVITVFWSSTGELAGIGTRVSEEAVMNSVGSKNVFASSEEFVMPQHAWITELVIISEDIIGCLEQPDSVGSPNRDRQLVVRTPDNNTPFKVETNFPYAELRFVFDALMGIYCHWCFRYASSSNLTVVGGLTSKCSSVPIIPTRMKREQQGRFWTPIPPPVAIKEVGKVYGQRTEDGKQIPRSQTAVSWLDCSRPISSIKVTLCHASKSSLLPLVSLSLNYADDKTTSSIGPTEFHPPSSVRENELEKPRYTHDEWDAGGACLKYALLWVDKKGVLTGLQFTTEDGKESLAWGDCIAKKNPSRMPLQVESKSWGAGIKIWVDEMYRQVTRDDYIVTAMQLIMFDKT